MSDRTTKTFPDRDAALIPMVIPRTLGPGDDPTPNRPRGLPRAVGGPPRPGDDDPTPVHRGEASAERGPLAPGEPDPNDVRPAFRMLAQPAPVPGQTYVGRRITVFPIETKE